MVLLEIKLSELKSSELSAAREMAALYVNRFVVELTAAGVRIAFLETNSGGDSCVGRASTIMSYQDAIELRTLLDDMLVSVEESLSKAKSLA
jgi:hypothetical protein